MAGSITDIISNLRAIIISSKGGLKLTDVAGDYKETFGVDIPLKTLECDSIEELFSKNPQDFKVIGSRVQAITKSSSLHIVSLVNRQKTTKKPGRSKLVSKDDGHFRTPMKSNIPAAKSNHNIPVRPLKQNSKDTRTNATKGCQQPAISKKNITDGENISKVISVSNVDPQDKNIKENFDSEKKKNLKENKKATKNNRREVKDAPYLPFENVEDLSGPLASQLRFLKANVTSNKTHLMNNDSSSRANNEPSHKSPFRRSLLNNFTTEMQPAEKFNKIQNVTVNKSLSPKQNETTNCDFANDLQDGSKYEDMLKQFCKEKGILLPTFSIIVRESSSQKKTYGCKLNFESGFTVSTYPVETHSESTARELASRKAYNQLVTNNNLSHMHYDTRNVIRLVDLCQKRNLPHPVFKFMECHPKNQRKYFICKVRIGEDILLSSYPFEALDETSAKDLAAMKAYEHLSNDKSGTTPKSKNDGQTLLRIYDLIKVKDYGVWHNKVPILYLDAYNEEIPSDWFDLVKKSLKFEITTVEKVGFIIRLKNDSEMITESDDITLAELKLPESNQWEVYITNVVSSAEIWCRLIGKNYSEEYDTLMTKLELHPPKEKVESPVVGEIYSVNLEESWNRVRVVDVSPDKNEISVFLIDVGVDEVVKKSQLFVLPKEFFSLAPQAILLSLNELDCLAECEELQVALFHSLLGNTFIAEVVAVLDDGGNVSSVNLWDTSTDHDINVNLKLLDDVVKAIKSPTLPTMGIVKEMYVSHVDDSGVYLQESKQNATFLEWIISTKIKNSGSSVFVVGKQIDSKKLYVTRSTKTGLFYRAKLVKTLDSSAALMKFIDYGQEQQAAVDDLLDLEQTALDLATIPSQSIRVKLGLTKCIGPKILDKIRDSILEQSVLVKVIQTPVGSPPLVEILKRSQTDGTLSSINKIINENEDEIASLPSRKKSYVVGLENTLTRNLPMPNIPPAGGYFNVFVTLAAHPGLFNVQPLSTQKELMDLMSRLQQKCENTFSKPLSPDEFKIGELYAVKYSDNRWYRAYAQASAGSSLFILCLCDFGDFVDASPEKLMPLPAEFKMFPYQAIRAYLAGIAPVEKDWTALDCVQFRELVVEKKFVSQVIEINTDVKNPNYISLGLVLVDTSTSEDIYIHKLLIDRKMAVLKSNSQSSDDTKK